jgi:hypothetical protein
MSIPFHSQSPLSLYTNDSLCLLFSSFLSPHSFLAYCSPFELSVKDNNTKRKDDDAVSRQILLQLEASVNHDWLLP